ncbi:MULTISPECIES: hypothetical protein [unclassified Sphingomonas]|uniref:hypothetical protein n=1 Tax=unclassified Sphingomonas TaxID=196159 RepID=UPI0022B47281|nr:hypothetical protein [Sphingomonas sp. NIBR02145]WHU03729.1 hypothetical protein O3305_03765 [Sphingomonas sp. NIBR02145]
MSRRLDILTRHHDRLIEIMATARTQITDSVKGADLDALRHLRREMVEALAAYQRFVHEEIYEPAQQGIGSAEARRDARALKIDCIQLQRDYDDFGLRWARRHVLENWPEYRLSANLMMKRVNDHILHVCELRKGWSSGQAA